MMYKFRNSIFSKCLQVLLICYFLLSSINITNSFKNLKPDTADVENAESTFGIILKKIFKCSGCTEEFDDYETKTNNNKSMMAFDYLVPGHTWLITHNSFTKLKSRLHIANTALMCSFYCKIHLPPPEVIL